jgi:hypothetical protein
MRAAISKAEIESEISSRFGSAFKLHQKRPAEVIPTGITQIDSFTFGGFPRGAITEIFGPASSGRTSLMFSALTHATRHDEVCALVDTSNGFDPQSAAKAEMNFERLLWIRCANNLEHAFKATDLLLQAGGFGLVTLDLGDVPAKSARRIISSWWYRFRRTLEATSTALVVIAEESCVRSCATLALEFKGESSLWSSSTDELRGRNAKNYPVNTFRHNRPVRPSCVPISPALIKANCRQTNPLKLSHSNLLQSLNFKVECQRPLYLNPRGIDIIVSIAR